MWIHSGSYRFSFWLLFTADHNFVLFPLSLDIFLGVPVCSEFCDSWFEACKTDYICVENVLEHYNFSVHGENFCPSDKNCTLYATMYGNGKGLCEKMWGGSYIYTEANADHTNCLLMYFNGTNPNGNVNPSVASTIINNAFINCAIILMALFLNQ